MEVAIISSAHLIHASTALAKPCRLRIHSYLHPMTNRSHSKAIRLTTSTKFKLYTGVPSTVATEPSENLDSVVEHENPTEKFDWYAEWYPIIPVCDLDKRVPHAKKILGLDLVVWWDKNENAWKVFDDTCPHRLAPLSEGRIDRFGRLQCVYHGWCFNGYGDCKFIPQAPPNGPPVQASKKACVAVYPSTVQNELVWFWPNSDPKYKDIILKKKPPFIPELDDPSFSSPDLLGSRDLDYGYEVLIENLMDPAHVPYAHYGMFQLLSNSKNREGGRPLELSMQKLDINGFSGKLDSYAKKFVAPCTLIGEDVAENHGLHNKNLELNSPSKISRRRMLFIFFCIPVSPGKSRLIWAFPMNFRRWASHIIPRWILHLLNNLVLDSDMYLLHVEEHKIMEIGSSNWQKACYVPAKADGFVVGYRRWLNKYAGGQVHWRGKYAASQLPPTLPRKQLLDRYWTHVVNCRSCNAAYKALNAAEVALQVFSIIAIGAVAVTKHGVISAATRTAVVTIAILSFAASRWLSHFIYKNFHFHDYNHALL